jgi:hypothetical protein
MTIPRNYEREKRILDCWKQDMTIDQATTSLNEKRSTVGYYYGKFNKAEKRGESQKYSPEEITRLDKISPRYSNMSPIKKSDSKDILSKHEEAFMDLILYEKFQSSFLKEDYQKAIHIYQTWMIGKNWKKILKKTGIEEVQKVLDLMVLMTYKPNSEVEKEINKNLNKITKFIIESKEDDKIRKNFSESKLERILDSIGKPKKGI